MFFTSRLLSKNVQRKVAIAVSLTLRKQTEGVCDKGWCRKKCFQWRSLLSLSPVTDIVNFKSKISEVFFKYNFMLRNNLKMLRTKITFSLFKYLFTTLWTLHGETLYCLKVPQKDLLPPISG